MERTTWSIGSVVAAVGLALATATSAQTVDPNFYVFLAFGQSNMEGNAALPSPAVTLGPRYQNLSAVTCGSRSQGKWAAAVSPLVRCDTKFSPLEYFGKTLTDSLTATIKVGIVPVAVAGSAIRGFDPRANKAYYAAEASWMQSIANQYGGDPYARLLALAKIAQQTGVIKGILLHQGETDGYKSGWGDTVKYIYNQLLTDLNLKATDVPLLAGEVYNNAGTNAGIDGLPKIIPTAHVVSSAGCAAGSDNLHFSVAGYQTLGTRFAQTMLRLLPRQTDVARRSSPFPPSGPVEYALFDMRGAHIADFHAQDEAEVESRWSGLRPALPHGLYWIRNSATGVSRKVVNSL